MAYVTRYQVFLSSTFTDLKEERAEVIQALWELDCIPTGMEAFLASNISQWEIITRVIDQCDYYMLIIGGRYGSLTSEGVSYTEKEYNYAKSTGMPVLAFVHGRPEQIAVGKTEADEALRAKLKVFRERVMKEHPIREWTTAHQLGSIASRSLVQEIKRSPRPGWIRNDGTSRVALLERVDALSQENAALRGKLSANNASSIPLDQLASGSDETTLSGTATAYTKYQTLDGTTVTWSAEVSWNTIFANVGPSLQNEGTQSDIARELRRFIVRDPSYPFARPKVGDTSVANEHVSRVIIQLRALGLIEKGTRKRGINDKASYWKLTEAGDRLLVTLLAERKDHSTDVLPDGSQIEAPDHD